MTALAVARGGQQVAGHLLAVDSAVLVRAGAIFINGKLVERPGEISDPEAIALSVYLADVSVLRFG